MFLRSTIVVSSLSIIVQAIGFLKLLLIAHVFGVSTELDAYYLALVIPGLLLGFVGGALQTGFMPIYGSLINKKLKDEAVYFRSHLFWILLLILVLICSLTSFFAENIIQLIAPSSSDEIKQYAGYALSILVVTLALNVVADFFGMILNMHQQFFSAALAPVSNIIVSTLFLYLLPELGIDNLIWGLVSGLFVQVLILWLVLYSQKLKFVFSFSFKSPHLFQAWQLMLPILLGVALANANLSVDQAMAAMAGDGAISLLGYASRFQNVITQTAIMGVSIVLLPSLIHLLSDNEIEKAFALMKRIFQWTLLLSLLLIAFVWFFGENLLNLLLSRGAFSVKDASSVYNIWFLYTLGVFPMACGVFYAKFFQAMKKPRVITRLAFISFIMNVFFNYMFVDWIGVNGIALSTSMVYGIVLLLFYFESKKLGDHFA